MPCDDSPGERHPARRTNRSRARRLPHRLARRRAGGWAAPADEGRPLAAPAGRRRRAVGVRRRRVLVRPRLGAADRPQRSGQVVPDGPDHAHSVARGHLQQQHRHPRSVRQGVPLLRRAQRQGRRPAGDRRLHQPRLAVGRVRPCRGGRARVLHHLAVRGGARGLRPGRATVEHGPRRAGACGARPRARPCRGPPERPGWPGLHRPPHGVGLQGARRPAPAGEHRRAAGGGWKDVAGHPHTQARRATPRRLRERAPAHRPAGTRPGRGRCARRRLGPTRPVARRPGGDPTGRHRRRAVPDGRVAPLGPSRTTPSRRRGHPRTQRLRQGDPSGAPGSGGCRDADG